jgi:hypothetical protein
LELHLELGTALEPNLQVVLVLINYGEISTEELLDGEGGVDALLMGFMPHFGAPVAEALFGRTRDGALVSVGGKLPYTIYPNNYTSQIDFLDMSLTAGPGRGYRYYKGTPLFEFGSGLSYTRFNLSLLTMPTASAAKAPTKAATKAKQPQSHEYHVQVANVGSRAGTETVQLYFVPPASAASSLGGAPVPMRKLLSFRKLALSAGAAAQVSFTVTASDLQLVDVHGERKAVPGAFTLLFTNGNGASVHATFNVGS